MRRAHQLIVADFNAELGLRTRSTAQASLLQGENNNNSNKTRAELALEGGNHGSGGRTTRSAQLPTTSSSTVARRTILGSGKSDASIYGGSGGGALPRPSAEAAANLSMASERPSSSLWSSNGNSNSSSGGGGSNNGGKGSENAGTIRVRRPRQRSDLMAGGSETVSSTSTPSVSSPVIKWGKPTKRRSPTASDDEDEDDDGEEDNSNSASSRGGRVMRSRREREVVTSQDGALRSIERAREIEQARALKRQSRPNPEQIAIRKKSGLKDADSSSSHASKQRSVRAGIQYCTLEEEENEEVEDAMMESGEGTALVIGVISPTAASQAADTAVSADAAVSSRGRRRRAPHRDEFQNIPQGAFHNYDGSNERSKGDRTNGRVDDATTLHSKSSSFSSSTFSSTFSSPAVPTAAATCELWARAAAAAEKLGMADLRRCLVNRGLDPQTHGVVGAPRHFALKQKLLQAVASSATSAEDAWAKEHTAFLGHAQPPHYDSSSSSDPGKANVVAAAASRQWQGDGKLQLEAFVADPLSPPPKPPSHAAPAWFSAISLPKNKEAVAARAKAEAMDRALDSDSESD